jgi:hypothetical protein
VRTTEKKRRTIRIALFDSVIMMDGSGVSVSALPGDVGQAG